MAERTNDLGTKAAAAALLGLGIAVVAVELMPKLAVGLAKSVLPDFRRLLNRSRCELIGDQSKLLPAAPTQV